MKARNLIAAALIALFICPVALHAGQYDLKEMTPEVQAALSARQNRYAQLKALKPQGIIGETHHGYIKVLQPSPEASALAEEENRDRGIIYRAIILQHALGSEGLAAVEKSFGAVQLEKASPGEMVQLPSGEWVRK